jgi:prophage DNA circulation protein
VEYTTHEDATAARDSVADLLDEQMLEAGDTAYPALVELRASVVQAVPGDAELARIETIERPVTVSSILLAYRLYGSTELELDLVARNNPRHPGFMSGTLQVLSHG